VAANYKSYLNEVSPFPLGKKDSTRVIKFQKQLSMRLRSSELLIEDPLKIKWETEEERNFRAGIIERVRYTNTKRFKDITPLVGVQDSGK
jgi:hypothetical protein